MLQENSLLYRFKKNSTIFISILKSRKPEALYVFWLKFLQLACLPLNYLFYFLETIFYRKPLSFNYPHVFVVGIQRTGSTFVSQVMEEAFPFYPIGNFASIFPHSAVLAHKIGKCFYKQKKTARYKNYYGISKGLFALGDCYEVWDRWFGNNHYKTPKQLSEKQRQTLLQYFNRIENVYNRPVISKNNRNGMCIRLLNSVFPNAFFVITERNAVDVVKSVLKASNDFFGTSNILWGSKPLDGFKESHYKNLTQAACVQYHMLNADLQKQISELPANKYVRVPYEAFCNQPNKYLDTIYTQLCSTFGLAKQEINYKFLRFSKSKRIHNNAMEEEIQTYLAELKSETNT